MTKKTFDLVCEIEPPTRPDLTHVRHQIGVLAPLAQSFLIPDNHIGRATVSSIAVVHEVAAMGGRSIACLNSRDRNLLGFRRDMLTAAAYGVEQFLFVYGDKPSKGNRTSDLNVRIMIEEARALAADAAFATSPAFRIGVATGLRPVPNARAGVQAACEQVLQLRDSGAFDGVHLVPVSRYREVALQLEGQL